MSTGHSTTLTQQYSNRSNRHPHTLTICVLMLANCRHLCPFGYYVKCICIFIPPHPQHTWHESGPHFLCHCCPCLCKIKSLNSITSVSVYVFVVRAGTLYTAQFTDFEENFLHKNVTCVFVGFWAQMLLLLFYSFFDNSD